MKPTVTPPFWEAAYAADARPFGAPSAELLDLIARLPRGSRVLDLGCGDGRNALPFLRAGHRVTAVDRSRAALDALRRAAAVERSEAGGVAGAEPLDETDPASVGLELVHADLRHMSPLDHYDLVIAHGVLHLLRPADRDWVIDRMRRHTRPGGWNVVAAFTDALPPPADLAPHCLGLFRPGELFLRYGDWAVELERSYVLEDEHPGGIRHRHPVEKVVARRPSS